MSCFLLEKSSNGQQQSQGLPDNVFLTYLPPTLSYTFAGGSLICFVCLVQPHETAYHSIRGICGEIQNEEITRKFPSVREKPRYWWMATKKQIPSSHNWGCLLLTPKFNVQTSQKNKKKNPVTGGGGTPEELTLSAQDTSRRPVALARVLPWASLPFH